MTVAVVPQRPAGRHPASTSPAAVQPSASSERLPAPALAAISLFSGIAGLDSGLAGANVRAVEMCESWEPARRVLAHQFPTTFVADDVTSYTPTPNYSVLSAGFPCTDLSHAGSKAGIFGPQSGLVDHVFRIAAATSPPWIVLENVPNLLALHNGAGMTEVVQRLEALGYQWAYRTVDSRFTGVPQRRYRVIVLASLVEDPAPRLLGEDAAPYVGPGQDGSPGGLALTAHTDAKPAHGFYWTEGRNGLGLITGAIPTLKGGSTIGTPSAPAVWFPNAPRGRKVVLPRVEDGEELQGLPRGWTSAAIVDGERDLRWKLLGNAVTRGVGAWIGERITTHPSVLADEQVRLAGPVRPGQRWPKAATGGPGRAPLEAHASDHPRQTPIRPLADIVDVDLATPLSHRATRGFLSRVAERPRRFDASLYADLEEHLAATRPKVPTASLRPSRRSGAPTDPRQPPTGIDRMRVAMSEIGLRYQLERRPVADLHHRMDIVFPGARVAVSLRSCFWDGCPDHVTRQGVDADRWASKMQRRRNGNLQAATDLQERGWLLIEVWEHDDPHRKATEIQALVAHRRLKQGSSDQADHA